MAEIDQKGFGKSKKSIGKTNKVYQNLRNSLGVVDGGNFSRGRGELGVKLLLGFFFQPACLGKIVSHYSFI